MRAPRVQANSTARPTVSVERSVPSIGTSRCRYMRFSSGLSYGVLSCILGWGKRANPPRGGGVATGTRRQARLRNPDSELILKVTPPRAPRHLLARLRLGSEDAQYRDRPVILVHAPAGFGKTSLLAQWRREQLARGAAVAWLSLDGTDHMQRLVHCLVLAVRTAWGRPDFGRTLLEGNAAAAGLGRA